VIEEDLVILAMKAGIKREDLKQMIKSQKKLEEGLGSKKLPADIPELFSKSSPESVDLYMLPKYNLLD
jgi:hypothetical protein